MRGIYFFCSLFLLSIISPLSFSANPAAPVHHPLEFHDSLKNKDEATVGKAVFEKICATCHALKPIINLGAPRIGTQSEWQARIDARNANEMLKNIDAGLNAMPPRGGCFECSDKELLAAIKYMLPQNLKKKE